MSEIDISVEKFQTHMASVRAVSTAAKYADNTKLFLSRLKTWGYQSLTELPPSVLSRYSSELASEHYAPQSVHLYVQSAKRYLRWVREQGVEVVLPHAPDLPRVTHKIRDIMPEEMYARYFSLCDSLLEEPKRTAVKLMPCIGLRGGELSRLQLSSLIRKHVKLKDGSTKSTLVVKLAGKGGDERIVPFIEEGENILVEYLAGWRRFAKGSWLFPATRKGGKAISDRALRDSLTLLREPLGMDFTPHTMRRTYIVALWRRGVSESVIAKIAGHKNIQTTFKHYLSLDETDILEAVHGEPRRFK